ncbi:HNH endonuclease signature motif containing protein [Micromonospora taraxaci]|uniref:HNH endonuclease signature motif containing protein n=1 Tax=Micromonospora taraxaci TaxID=1316803 RepID=UPI0033E23072
MSRSVPEWIGKTDDAAIPPRVRLRVFDAHNGICHISGRRIQAGEPWDIDHVIALINGGEHRESNMAPALRDKHRAKTVEDVAIKSRDNRKRAKSLGIKKRTSFRGWRKMNGDIVFAKEVRNGRADRT